MKIIWRSKPYKPWARRLVHMSPTKFLSLCTKPPAWSKSSLAYIRARVKAKKSLETPFLDVDPATGRVLDHEGRHRAIVAKEMGIRRIPVYIYFKSNWRFVESKRRRLPPLKKQRNW